jgi:hypothetical protein
MAPFTPTEVARLFAEFRRLDAGYAIELGDHHGKLGRRRPVRVQPLEICVAHPTGGCAAFSDEDGDLIVEELLNEFLRRRNADALDPLGRLAQSKLRRVPGQHDRAALS